LDEASLIERSIDIETYDRHAEKFCDEPTLVRIERHSGQLDELDVEGILAVAERVLPRAADLWVQTSLEQRQRFQQLFFPDGISFDGNGFVRTAKSAPVFSYLRPIEAGKGRCGGPQQRQLEAPDEVARPARGDEAGSPSQTLAELIPRRDPLPADYVLHV
jgi:hypothetical protein